MNLYRNLSDKVRVWDSQVGQFEELATIQLHEIASLPVVEGIRAMPDSHWGLGACVGSVIALKKAVIPAAVGVDIGCGMMAAKTSLSSHHLPENLKRLRSNIALLLCPPRIQSRIFYSRTIRSDLISHSSGIGSRKSRVGNRVKIYKVSRPGLESMPADKLVWPTPPYRASKC